MKRLIVLVFHLTSLSLAVYMRPTNTEQSLTEWPREISDIGRLIAECITVIGVLCYISIQLGGEILNIGIPSFLIQLVWEYIFLNSPFCNKFSHLIIYLFKRFQTHEPAKFIFVLSNLMILACIPCRLKGDRHLEDAILVVAVPASWFFLMFFAG